MAVSFCMPAQDDSLALTNLFSNTVYRVRYLSVTGHRASLLGFRSISASSD